MKDGLNMETKPKYLIRYCYTERETIREEYYKGYMEGMTSEINEAYLYTEEEILENLKEWPYWFDTAHVITQVYDHENWKEKQ